MVPSISSDRHSSGSTESKAGEEDSSNVPSSLLEGWMARRWLAVLCWIGLAAMTHRAMNSDIINRLWASTTTLRANILTLAPLRFANLWETLPWVACSVWFQPVVLRLGLIRAGLWIVVSTVVWTIWFGPFAGVHPWVGILGQATAFAIAGLTAAGQRSRPWMSIVAGLVSMIAFILVYPRLEFLLSGGRFWVYSALLELPLAVVMVYGTERLARTGTGAWGRSQTKE
jgi:hypothetical protein